MTAAAPAEPHGVPLRPVGESGSRSKRPLVLALTLITVLAAGVGAFVVSRGSPSDSLDVETPRLVTDTETDTAFSFSAATSNADAAGSVRFEMSSTTPEGNMSMVAVADRASQRISVTADLSELVVDDSFLETPDSLTMILDESTSTMYLGSEFMGMLMDAPTPWISMNTNDMDDGGALDELFANPFEMSAMFGDAEPVDLGLETIQGEELRHFQVPVRVLDMLADPDAGSDFVDLRDVEGIEELDEVVFDVWIGADNTIRRIVLDLVIAGQTSGFDMWIEMSAEGAEIALPAPADVTDLEELFSSWATDFEQLEPPTDDAADFGATVDPDDAGSAVIAED